MSVSTVENREEGWLPFPDFSAYVTVKLDPVKSVEHLKDEEATAAASTALSNTYVGYISGVRAPLLYFVPNSISLGGTLD